MVSGPEMEPDVLPVFYYNDLLLSRIGDTIGLNLFEPRYLEMCRRLAADPRFLFMPNFQDYHCRPGDVGFVVRLTGLWPQARGRAFGVQGFAERLVAVACSWEEPDTEGLHCAQFWALDPKKAPLQEQEFWALLQAMKQSGWQMDPESFSRLHFSHLQVPGTDVLFSSNWQNQTFVLAFLASPEAERCFVDTWLAAQPALAAPRLSGPAFLEALQRFPGLAKGVPLDEVMAEMRQFVAADPEALRSLLCLAEGDDLAKRDPLRVPQELWRQLLARLRLARVENMPARMDTARLELGLLDGPGGLEISRSEACPKTIGVLMTNGRNVELWSRPEDVEVTEESARSALMELNWKLNRLRLAVVQRARRQHLRPLALLEDDAAYLVFSFVAERPPSDE
ncbi:unnamed protein product [Effrenium voratum]|uniref:Uncharacterized protein n=2 Tax=Effrenium voratum TaxID=2562239 RepID=A0AA36HJ93_9DINO|nr:unnamed protein product [Effrenium voratum]CAJ1370196.1 unnamed protein product [Effrenium voratum]